VCVCVCVCVLNIYNNIKMRYTISLKDIRDLL